jgi:hypothetical protein
MTLDGTNNYSTIYFLYFEKKNRAHEFTLMSLCLSVSVCMHPKNF